MIQGEEEVAIELFNLLKSDTDSINAIKHEGMWSSKLVENNKLLGKETFAGMNLKNELLEAIYGLEVETPSLIQQKAIPIALTGVDLICQSQSGSGKTIAFACVILNIINSGEGPQAIIIAPTRELSIQIGDFIDKLGASVNIKTYKALKGNRPSKITEEVIVGTPGSIYAHMRDGYIKESQIKIVVFDEADAVMDVEGMGSMTQRIILKLKKAQKLYFSATFSKTVKDQIDYHSPNATSLLEEKNTKPEDIRLYYMEINKADKPHALLELYELLPIGQSIVFVATKKMAEILKKKYESDMHKVSFIHGDMDLQEREKSVKNFRGGYSKILISTDVFSRGMDVPQVNLVINFDLPIPRGEPCIETYIHRIGRTGRFGRLGFVIDFISNTKEVEALMKIQEGLNFPAKKFSMESLRKVSEEQK